MDNGSLKMWSLYGFPVLLLLWAGSALFLAYATLSQIHHPISIFWVIGPFLLYWPFLYWVKRYAVAFFITAFLIFFISVISPLFLTLVSFYAALPYTLALICNGIVIVSFLVLYVYLQLHIDWKYLRKRIAKGYPELAQGYWELKTTQHSAQHTIDHTFIPRKERLKSWQLFLQNVAITIICFLQPTIIGLTFLIDRTVPMHGQYLITALISYGAMFASVFFGVHKFYAMANIIYQEQKRQGRPILMTDWKISKNKLMNDK